MVCKFFKVQQRRGFRLALRSSVLIAALFSLPAWADDDGDVVGTDIDVADGAISASEIAANAVGYSEMKNNAIGNDEMRDNAIGLVEMKSNAIGNAEMRDNAIGNEEMKNNAIGSAEVINNSLTANDLATDSVGADELDANAVAREVGTALLADPSVVADFSDELANLEANASNLLGDLASNSSDAAQGQLASVLGNNFLVSGGAGDGTAVTTGSVTVLDIANRSVVADDLADGAVTSRTIATGAVTNRTIADDAVTTRTIATGAVTNRTIAEGAVNSFSIADYSIQGQDIADGAITERKLSADLIRRINQSGAGIKTASRGISMAFAMANVPQLSAGSDHSFGISFGAFQGETALAIGLNSRLEGNAVGRFSVSKSGKYWGAGAGVAWEW